MALYSARKARKENGKGTKRLNIMFMLNYLAAAGEKDKDE